MDSVQVYTFGLNASGQLGHPTGGRSLHVPTLLETHYGKRRVVQLACGSRHTWQILENGDCNAWGEIPVLAGFTDKSTSRRVEGPPGLHVKHISCGQNSAAAVLSDGEVYLWTMQVTAFPLWKRQAEDDTEKTTSTTSENSDQTEVAKKVVPTSPIKKVACCDDHIVSLSEDGVVYETDKLQGNNSFWEKTTIDPNTTIIDLGGKTIVDVQVNQMYSAAITDNGELYTWGIGPLGHNFIMKEKPFRVEGPLIGKKVVSVACGVFHMACVTDTGELYTWGSSAFNQLGHGDKLNLSEPKKVAALEGKRVVGCACGVYHTAVITDSGQLYTFGYEQSGALGHGAKAAEDVPALVEALNGRFVQQVACGWYHTVVVVGSDPGINILKREIGNLLEEPEFSDVQLTIRESGWSIPCHRVILAARCPGLVEGGIEALTNLQEGKTVFVAGGIDKETCLHVLRYIYSEAVDPKLQDTPSVLLILMEVALKCKLEALLSKAIACLNEGISTKSVGQIWKLLMQDSRFVHRKEKREKAKIEKETNETEKEETKAEEEKKEEKETEEDSAFDLQVVDPLLDQIINFILKDFDGVFRITEGWQDVEDHLMAFDERIKDKVLKAKEVERMNQILSAGMSETSTPTTTTTSTNNDNTNNTNDNDNTNNDNDDDLANYESDTDVQTAGEVLLNSGALSSEEGILPLPGEETDDASKNNTTTTNSEEEKQEEEPTAQPVDINSLSAQLATYVNSPSLSDVIFLVEDRKVYGHKCILCARSKHFRAMFTLGMKEASSDEVPVGDVSFDAFLSLLQYLYSGRVDISEETVVELLMVANQYTLQHLQDVAESFIEKGIFQENVAYLLEMAHRFQTHHLKTIAMNYLLEQRHNVDNLEGFTELSQEVMTEFKKNVAYAPKCTASDLGVSQCFQGETGFFKITARDEFGTKCTRGGEKFDIVMVDGLWLSNWQMDRTYQKNIKRREELVKLFIENREKRQAEDEEKRKEEREKHAKTTARWKETANEGTDKPAENNEKPKANTDTTLEEVKTKEEGKEKENTENQTRVEEKETTDEGKETKVGEGNEATVEEKETKVEGKETKVGEETKEGKDAKIEEKEKEKEVDANPNSIESLAKAIRSRPSPWPEDLEFLDLLDWFEYYKATRHLEKRPPQREWEAMRLTRKNTTKLPLDASIKLESTRLPPIVTTTAENKDKTTTTQKESEPAEEWINVEFREWNCWRCTFNNAPSAERCVMCNSASPLYLLDHVNELPKSDHFDSIAVLGNHDGTYLVSYTPHKSGQYSLCVTLGGKHIAESPFALITEPAYDGTKCTAEGPGLTTAIARHEALFTIQARDNTGEPIKTGGKWFSVRISNETSVGGGSRGSVTDRHDGTYQVRYSVPEVGRYYLHITLGQTHIVDSPFYIKVLPGPTHSSTTSAIGEGLNTVYFGRPALFTIIASDEWGNPRDSGGDEFIVTITRVSKQNAPSEKGKPTRRRPIIRSHADLQNINDSNATKLRKDVPDGETATTPTTLTTSTTPTPEEGELSKRKSTNEEPNVYNETPDASAAPAVSGLDKSQGGGWEEINESDKDAEVHVTDQQSGIYVVSYTVNFAEPFYISVKLRRKHWLAYVQENIAGSPFLIQSVIMPGDNPFLEESRMPEKLVRTVPTRRVGRRRQQQSSKEKEKETETSSVDDSTSSSSSPFSSSDGPFSLSWLDSSPTPTTSTTTTTTFATTPTTTTPTSPFSSPFSFTFDASPTPSPFLLPPSTITTPPPTTDTTTDTTDTTATTDATATSNSFVYSTPGRATFEDSMGINSEDAFSPFSPTVPAPVLTVPVSVSIPRGRKGKKSPHVASRAFNLGSSTTTTTTTTTTDTTTTTTTNDTPVSFSFEAPLAVLEGIPSTTADSTDAGGGVFDLSALALPNSEEDKNDETEDEDDTDTPTSAFSTALGSGFSVDLSVMGISNDNNDDTSNRDADTTDKSNEKDVSPQEY